MTHERCIELLDDYVDDELSPSDRREVDAHLESCTSCSAERESLSALVELAGDLPRGLSGDDRWTEVAEGLDTRTPSRRFPVAAVALAATALLAVGAVSLWEPPEPVQPPAPVVAPTPEAEPEVVADLRDLVGELETKVAARTALDPETAAHIQDNLRTIDAAIQEIEAALDDHPADASLTRSLTRAYQHKIGVLSLVVRS